MEPVSNSTIYEEHSSFLKETDTIKSEFARTKTPTIARPRPNKNDILNKYEDGSIYESVVESVESDEDDYVDNLDFEKKIKDRQDAPTRHGVSAEVFGKNYQRPEFQPIKILKNDEQSKKIRERISENVFMKNSSSKDKIILEDAMEIFKFNEGDTIINQGEDGNIFYVLDEGQADCFKDFGDGEKWQKTYYPGEGFGELAQQYNAPRAATIKAKTNCTLFGIDRVTFINVIQVSVIKKRDY